MNAPSINSTSKSREGGVASNKSQHVVFFFFFFFFFFAKKSSDAPAHSTHSPFARAVSIQWRGYLRKKTSRPPETPRDKSVNLDSLSHRHEEGKEGTDFVLRRRAHVLAKDSSGEKKKKNQKHLEITTCNRGYRKQKRMAHLRLL